MTIVQNSRSRTWKLGLPTTLTEEHWAETLRACDERCIYCRKRRWEELDHFVPVLHGGGTTPGNAAPACRRCNIDKSHAPPTQFCVYLDADRVGRAARFLAARSIGKDFGWPPRDGRDVAARFEPSTLHQPSAAQIVSLAHERSVSVAEMVRRLYQAECDAGHDVSGYVVEHFLRLEMHAKELRQMGRVVRRMAS